MNQKDYFDKCLYKTSKLLFPNCNDITMKYVNLKLKLVQEKTS